MASEPDSISGNQTQREGKRTRKAPLRIIRKGSVVVKIYRVHHRRTGDLYAVAWYSGGRRRLQQFADLSKALEEARLKAAQLAAGRIEAAEVTGTELETLRELRRIAGEVPLLPAMEEWRKARDLVGADIIRACEMWRDRNRGKSARNVTVTEAVDQFLAAKRKQGVDVSCSYLRSFPPFKQQFGALFLRDLTASSMQAWLDTTFEHPVSRNTIRKRVVTLFRWARKQGLLPRDVLTEAERTERAREQPVEIGLIAPERFRAVLRLLAAEHPHYVPAAALAGFCGLRSVEVHGQDWKDVQLERGFVRVTRGKRGTPARRLVPLCPAAVEWLMPHRKAAGAPVCDNLAIDRIRDIARTAELELPENGFRNTFISARVAVTGDIPRTSTEAGNSVAMIHKHYRELMTTEEGEAWFDVRPEQEAVVPSGEDRAVNAS